MIANIELEQTILGSLLLNAKSFYEAQVSKSDFHDPVHQDIFSAIATRHANEQLVSPITVGQALDGHDGLKALAGGKYLVRLASAATGLSMVAQTGVALKELTRKRELQEKLAAALKDLEDDSFTADDVAGRVEVGLMDVSEAFGGGIVSMMQAVAGAADQAGEAHRGDGVAGVKTGIADLDAILGGLHPSQLVLLGGRPSMGKTAVALSVVLAAARSGVGVALSSLEMSPESLALRAISNETACRNNGVAYTDAMQGRMTPDNARTFFENAPAVGKLPIEILPETMRDIGSIYAGVKKTQRKLEGKGTPLGLVVIDYLQLISGKSRNRFELIAEISIALKAMAMRLKVPVLALSQLSRSLESRDLNNRRPMLSDLRESGQLEQDADTVLFCYRHEYYLERETPDEIDIEAQDALADALRMHSHKMEIIVAKQRMGQIGTVNIGCNLSTNFLWDLDNG